MAELDVELTRPELQELLAFWAARRRADAPPLSAEIEPKDIRRWLPDLVIMQVVSDGTFAYSYYGRSFAHAFGESRLGQTLRQLPGDQRAVLLDEYRRACRERRPICRVYTADFDGERQTWERLVLPLASDEGLVDKLLVAAYRL